MSVNIEYLKKHQSERNDMKVFLFSGNNTTMLTGKITSYDETSFVLDECLIQLDKVISITTKN